MSVALTNRHFWLLAALALKPEIAKAEPEIFQDLVRAGLAERSLKPGGDRDIGRPTRAGVYELDGWLAHRVTPAPVAGLTRRQEQARRFIAERLRLSGVAPTRQEIADHLGLASRSGAQRLVLGLEARGAIRRLAGRGRSLSLTDHERTKGANDLRPAFASPVREASA